MGFFQLVGLMINSEEVVFEQIRAFGGFRRLASDLWWGIWYYIKMVKKLNIDRENQRFFWFDKETSSTP